MRRVGLVLDDVEPQNARLLDRRLRVVQGRGEELVDRLRAYPYVNMNDQHVSILPDLVRAATGTLAAVALVLVVSSCTGASPAPPTPATGGPGCGDTQISPGRMPDWTAAAGVPADLPYAVSREANVVAVLFGYPLRAGTRDDGRSNKILWVMRDPRDGKPMHLVARPLGGGDPVTLTREADSSPGEIYPSIVDVPASGCWHMSLEWNRHTATIDLPYGT
jgi:hypothetical protein